jgi:hypothetical protein
MQLAAAGLTLAFLASPVQAVTCEEVRGLSATELADWAKRLKVTPASLTTLLEQSFCEERADRSRVIVSDQKVKAITIR